MIFMVKRNLYQKHFCGEIGFEKKIDFNKCSWVFISKKVWVLRKIPGFFKKGKFSFTNFAHSKDYVFLK